MDHRMAPTKTNSSSNIRTNNGNNTNNSNHGRIGPRAKCDQVVYEAIAKAAEIIVRSRCEIPNKNHHRIDSKNNVYGNNRNSVGSNHNGSSSRFNIEVGEVENVR